MTSDPQTWQVEASAAELYEHYLVRAVTLPWAVDLVDRVGLARGDQVLDVACGTGVVARVAAGRVGDRGRVVGLDLNRGMLEVAQAKAGVSDGASIEWVEGSAAALPFDDAEFGIVLCQLGLQFFEDRLGALTEMRRVLFEAGRLGLSVFTSIERNPAAHALSDALDRHLAEGASLAKRSEHSLPAADELRDVCIAAGFVGVRIETVGRMVRFPSAEEWVRIQFVATPLRSLLEGREPSDQQGVVDRVSADVRDALAPFGHTDGFAFPQEVHVALAVG